MFVAMAPPASVKLPPTNNCGPVPRSATCSALTRGVVLPSLPVLMADQLVPFHWAMRLTRLPPADVISPAAISLRCDPLTYEARYEGDPTSPVPSALQVDPFHFAMRAIGTPSTFANDPLA